MKREDRKIWSPLGITGADYITDDDTAWNNWTTANSVAIGNRFGLLGHEVVDFHRRTTDGTGSTIQKYCYELDDTPDAVKDTIQDGNADDIEGLTKSVNILGKRSMLSTSGGVR